MMKRDPGKWRRPAAVLAAVVLTVLLTGCGNLGKGKEEKSAGRDFFAMDTYFAITVYGERAEEAAEAAEAEMHRLEELLSTEIAESDIARLNRERETEVSGETLALLERSKVIWAETGGVFDIAVYPLMQAWGFVSGEHRVPAREEIDRLLPLADPEAIGLSPDSGRAALLLDGMAVDLGGIAKGYAAERLSEVFAAQGVEHAIADLGGNILAFGTKPDGSDWRVGVRDPEGDGVLGVISTSRKAVITSGGYEPQDCPYPRRHALERGS